MPDLYENDQFPHYLINQYSKSALQEIATNMEIHADMIWDANKEYFKVLLGKNELQNNKTWKVIGNLRQAAYHLREIIELIE